MSERVLALDVTSGGIDREEPWRRPVPAGACGQHHPQSGKWSGVDVTSQDMSAGWAAGALVGTAGDLNRFMVALVTGRLLKPAQLAEMQTTVPAPDLDASGQNRYGLGLATFTLTCGGTAWTHGGNAPGFSTVNAVTTNGKAATIAVTALPTAMEQVVHLETALDTALCG